MNNPPQNDDNHPQNW